MIFTVKEDTKANTGTVFQKDTEVRISVKDGNFSRNCFRAAQDGKIYVQASDKDNCLHGFPLECLEFGRVENVEESFFLQNFLDSLKGKYLMMVKPNISRQNPDDDDVQVPCIVLPGENRDLLMALNAEKLSRILFWDIVLDSVPDLNSHVFMLESDPTMETGILLMSHMGDDSFPARWVLCLKEAMVKLNVLAKKGTPTSS